MIKQSVAAANGVCAARGFRAGAAAADVRGDGSAERLDIALVVSDVPCQAAGVFTRNRVRAAPVVLAEETLQVPEARVVLINSGNANACTGDQGLRDARAMAALAADTCGVPPDQVLVCSTGVIGRMMPMDRIERGIRAASGALSTTGSDTVATAIMTTDTVPKQATSRFTVDGTEYIIGGMAKGAGMIHPDMATLIAVVTTDAAIAGNDLHDVLRRVADNSLNCVTVDGDTSTNDSLILLANGAAGGPRFTAASAALVHFEDALDDVLQDLAEQIVADAEGATKHFKVTVHEAASVADARLAARTIAASPLVKTAIHGGDPNWGRIVAALGRSGAEFAIDSVRVAVGPVSVFEFGAPAAATLDAVRDVFAQPRVDIELHLGCGACTGHAWGCDLTAEYVHINADYTT